MCNCSDVTLRRPLQIGLLMTMVNSSACTYLPYRMDAWLCAYRDSCIKKIFLCPVSLHTYQPRKLTFGSFGSLRKKKQEDGEEYVCPMDVEMPKGRSFQKGFGVELQIYEDDLDRLEQVSKEIWIFIDLLYDS